MEITTQDAYKQQWQNCLATNGAVAHNTNGFDRISYCRHQYSSDQLWELQLQSGLHLEWIDDNYHRNLRVRTEHGADIPLVAKFYLSGKQGVFCPGIPGVPTEYCEAAGQSYFFALPNIEEEEISLANQRVQFLRIYIEPNFFQTLGFDLASLPALLRRTLESGDRQPHRFHQALGKMTPAMQVALQQILQCPYRHTTKRLFLESKALELLALQLEQWLVLEQGEQPSVNLKATDIEHVHEAADILLKELSHPPSIIALAHRVALNEHKLKIGFRQVFKTTVFGYVRAQRLERARQLLLAGDVTVTQAALAVGYISQGHFAAAFRKQFGVNPRSLRQ
ncbi:helix-turn-helix transcriptional regulator [Vacuolonema iberomarrocanum]|uniref:helix-turn-helix transcriptional regulator n=1 Tax=Vacuolonema iberomarrocanum TaxID=3454632 RepID=UPI0019EDA7D5|nr:helix-turn-helix transcriptional regulator [filamentous cyanobacterium LEGE 07170]